MIKYYGTNVERKFESRFTTNVAVVDATTLDAARKLLHPCCYYPQVIYPDHEMFREELRKAISYHFKAYGHLVTSVDTAQGYEFFPAAYTSPLINRALGYEGDGTGSINVQTGWQSKDRIGIEEGAAFLLEKQGLD